MFLLFDHSDAEDLPDFVDLTVRLTVPTPDILLLPLYTLRLFILKVYITSIFYQGTLKLH
jgi:hypothetical protein